MSAKAFCACSEFGTAEEPKTLLAVLGHRRHRKHPECEDQPYILNDDGGFTRATYAIKSAAEQAEQHAATAAKRQAKAAAAELSAATAALEESLPPVDANPWSANATPVADTVQQIPDTPLGAPATLTGKAAMPGPDPKAGLATPAPLFSVTIRIDAGVAHCWDWTLQQGYSGSFEEWVAQTIKACYRDLLGIVPMMVPVGAAAVA
jgi:hypothetical protein